MTGPAFEAYLARIYTDGDARTRFLADRRGEALRAGLSPAEADALVRMDGDALALAADSFARKRGSAPGP